MKLFFAALIIRDFIFRVTFYMNNKIEVTLRESDWKDIMELPVIAVNPTFLSSLMFP